MAIHNPPEYRYPLFEEWDRETFSLIKKLAETKNYPAVTGSDTDKNQLLITFIRTQKSYHNWRDFPQALTEYIKRGVIDAKELIDRFPPESISKELPEWASYKGDKIVSDFIDELAERKITFTGTDKEMSEFVLRFLLGQLAHDWEQTIYMIREMLGTGDTLSLEDLNNELKNFDYCRLFE